MASEPSWGRSCQSAILRDIRPKTIKGQRASQAHVSFLDLRKRARGLSHPSSHLEHGRGGLGDFLPYRSVAQPERGPCALPSQVLEGPEIPPPPLNPLNKVFPNRHSLSR